IFNMVGFFYREFSEIGNLDGFLYPHLINGGSIAFCSIPPIRQWGLDIFYTIFFDYVKSDLTLT
uniref:hypothetical protein n=1 Tax=Acinetobacter pittii TaxID=48296 RepID=UPI001BC88863